MPSGAVEQIIHEPLDAPAPAQASGTALQLRGLQPEELWLRR